MFVTFFFFNDTATTEIYTLSLHDALPISCCMKNHPQILKSLRDNVLQMGSAFSYNPIAFRVQVIRSEEHTSELQSRPHLVCRLLLEKKKETTAPYMLISETTCVSQTVKTR